MIHLESDSQDEKLDDGPHFPEDARLEIRSEIGNDAREHMGSQGLYFLASLEELLSECEWTDEGISKSISGPAIFLESPEKTVFIIYCIY